jgi:hypothetical protein
VHAYFNPGWYGNSSDKKHAQRYLKATAGYGERRVAVLGVGD